VHGPAPREARQALGQERERGDEDFAFRDDGALTIRIVPVRAQRAVPIVQQVVDADRSRRLEITQEGQELGKRELDQHSHRLPIQDRGVGEPEFVEPERGERARDQEGMADGQAQVHGLALREAVDEDHGESLPQRLQRELGAASPAARIVDGDSRKNEQHSFRRGRVAGEGRSPLHPAQQSVPHAPPRIERAVTAVGDCALEGPAAAGQACAPRPAARVMTEDYNAWRPALTSEEGPAILHVRLPDPQHMILVAGDDPGDLRAVVQELRTFAPSARLTAFSTPDATPWASWLELLDGNDLRGLRSAVSEAQVVVALGASRPGPALAASILAASSRCPLILVFTAGDVERGISSTPQMRMLARHAVAVLVPTPAVVDGLGPDPGGPPVRLEPLADGALSGVVAKLLGAGGLAPLATDGASIASRREIEEVRAREKQARAEVARLQAELARVYRSRLWRVGALYRVIRSYLRRPFDALRRAMGAPPPPAGLALSRSAPRLTADQRQGLADRVAASRGVVVFPPTVGWDMPLFQRPHHIARAFVRRGYVAVFDCSNAGDEVDALREIEHDLFLFRGDHGQLHELHAPMVWTFTYNFHYAEAYPEGAIPVYDWIDDLSIFPQERSFLEASHARALDKAPVVAAVARRLLDELRQKRPDGLYLPNAVEYERFADPRALPAEDPALARFVAEGKPIAGYYGALAHWFDYDLLEEVTELRPDWNFVLIGPMYDQSLSGRKLLSRPNVLWTGTREYATLPGYLRRFDVATIPFQINEITLATSPLKLFEYFAAGKPVVTTPMPECVAFPEVRIARTAHEFSQALDAARAAGQDPAFRARLQEVARANSWVARVDSVLERLNAR
jgi:glycosyltransferase involved in cell wall biosynthesis